MDETTRERLIAGIKEILKGIDELETAPDHQQGWWETSSGVEFGEKKLQEIEDFIRSL